MLKLTNAEVINDVASRSAAAQTARLKDYIETTVLVVIWYTVNISLIISNKWLISETGLHSTSLLTLLHMLSSCAASNAALAAGLVPRRPMGRALLGRVVLLAASFTVAVATCMASLAYLPASFVQAIGSTTPGFTAVLAFLIQGRREAVVTYGALLPVAAGVALASGGEPLFSGVGLTLQVIACLARSFKTVLQAVLLTDERDRLHPMTLLAHTSAISAALLTALTVATEPGSLRQLASLHAAHAQFSPLLAGSCALAFLANWVNFIISQRLGALTLQVLGNFKNVVAAMAAVAVFANPVTGLGLLGYGLTTLGVFTYSHLVHYYPAQWVPAPCGQAFAYRPPLTAAGGAAGGGSSGGGGGEGEAPAGGKGVAAAGLVNGNGGHRHHEHADNGYQHQQRHLDEPQLLHAGDVEYGTPRGKRGAVWGPAAEERSPLLLGTAVKG